MGLKRIGLSLLSIFAISFIILTLASSWNRPQEQSRLDLLQTDLVLQATNWEPSGDALTLKSALLGNNLPTAYEQALKSYEAARRSNQQSIDLIEQTITTKSGTNADPNPSQIQQYQTKRDEKQRLIDELDLRIGLLQLKLSRAQESIDTWGQISKNQPNPISRSVQTARVLLGLWAKPVEIFPDAEPQIRTNLDSWSRNQALQQLYQAQQRDRDLVNLAQLQQTQAEQAFDRLLIVNSIPVIGGLSGILLLLGLGIQRAITKQNSILALPAAQKQWQVPWGKETVWEVMVIWFVSFAVVSQIILPVTLAGLNLIPNDRWSYRDQAVMVLITYIISVLPELPILSICLKSFAPLPEPWFRFKPLDLKWVGWGFGGYLAAVPIVFLASILVQVLLKGHGGSNTLLPILVESQDSVAKFILWTTLAISAPFFEELLFRGFLLPSLTKFLPFWAALSLSGFCFAVAHLNLSDILPLTVLGMVLGFVYMRSQNLLAPMLLHALWNSGSFLALLALGGR